MIGNINFEEDFNSSESFRENENRKKMNGEDDLDQTLKGYEKQIIKDTLEQYPTKDLAAQKLGINKKNSL